MKKLSRTLALCALLCALLCACGTEPVEDSAPQEEELDILSTETVQRSAQTAVLLDNTTLTQCYGSTADKNGVLVWVPIEKNTALAQGNLVLVLEITDEQARVYVPTGDSSNTLYGTLPAGVLSLAAADLQNASMASTDGCLGQNTEAPEAEQLSGLVKILQRDGTRCMVQLYGVGDERTFWVQTSDLSFDLNTVVPDRGADAK